MKKASLQRAILQFVTGLLLPVFTGCSPPEAATQQQDGEPAAASSPAQQQSKNAVKSGTGKNVEQRQKVLVTGIRAETLVRPAPKKISDAGETLKLISRLYDSPDLVPGPLEPPFDRDVCTAYVVQLAGLLQQRTEDEKWLAQLDLKDLSSESRLLASRARNLLSRIRDYIPRDIQDSLERTAVNVKANVEGEIEFIAFAANIDLKDRDRVVNVLVDPDQKQLRMEAIRRLDVLLQLAGTLKHEFESDLKPDEWWRERDRVVREFQRKVAQAVEHIRLPDAVDEPELLALATSTLALPKYGIAPVKRVLVVTPKRKKRRAEYSVDQGRVVQTDYVWDEFSAASVESEKDGYAVWFNTFAYFHDGANTTPVKRWVLRERFRSSPISQKAAFPK